MDEHFNDYKFIKLCAFLKWTIISGHQKLFQYLVFFYCNTELAGEVAIIRKERSLSVLTHWLFALFPRLSGHKSV